MGVYINMKMPKCCGDCFFNRQTSKGWRCTAAYPNRRRDFGNPLERPGRCPLVSVLPHGRLIDADAFRKLLTTALNDPNVTSPVVCRLMKTIITAIDDAPTIIPAEEGET